MEKDEEYELVPVTPIRRLEKEIEKLKKKGLGEDSVSSGSVEALQSIRKIVEETFKANNALLKETSSMIKKLSKTNESLNELINMLKEASKSAIEESASKTKTPLKNKKRTTENEKLKQLRSRFEELLDQNRVILDRLDKLEGELEVSSKRRRTGSFRY